jgi:hypothetical protein
MVGHSQGVPKEPAQRQRTDFERVNAEAALCSVQPFNDLSNKFRGFRPGYNVFVVGAFASHAQADRVRKAVTQCFPDAYIRYGKHLGE